MLQLTEEIYSQIRAHGEETYPHECCGVFLGASSDACNHVERAIRAGNTRTDSAHNRYHIAPVELIRIQREGGRRAWILSAFITRTRIIRRSGPRRIWTKRTGLVAPMS